MVYFIKSSLNILYHLAHPPAERPVPNFHHHQLLPYSSFHLSIQLFKSLSCNKLELADACCRGAGLHPRFKESEEWWRWWELSKSSSMDFPLNFYPVAEPKTFVPIEFLKDYVEVLVC